MRHLLVAFSVLCAVSLVRAEEIKVATYNVEVFDHHFMAHRLQNNPIAKDPVGKEILDELRKKNDEDNWETAQVILDPKFSPDILVMEEACDEGDLRFFNHRWLNDAYETALTFPTNSERHQNLDLLMKPGFKILEKKDQYYREPDPEGGNERGSRLFARGPSFVKVKSPGGYVFWVGVTHMKSKAVTESVATSRQAAAFEAKDTPELRQRKIDATKWRNREAKRTHEIILELQKAGPKDVILLGDMNDSLGEDEYEKNGGGGDAIANLVGPPSDGLILATKPLADAHQNSFNGYWRDRFRELIDHVVITPSMKDKVKDVQIFQDNFTAVSSDHFPVLVKIKTD
jgi:endonuclease/exonuclease/phosphatase family metal-dependent hydrolase